MFQSTCLSASCWWSKYQSSRQCGRKSVIVTCKESRSKVNVSFICLPFSITSEYFGQVRSTLRHIQSDIGSKKKLKSDHQFAVKSAVIQLQVSPPSHSLLCQSRINVVKSQIVSRRPVVNSFRNRIPPVFSVRIPRRSSRSSYCRVQ